MKRLLLITGLLLAGCSQQPPEQAMPLYEANKEKFVEIKTELRDCMQEVVDTDYYAMDRIRSGVQFCEDKAFDQLQFKKNPETFYVYWDGMKNGFDPYEDFTFCSSSLANGMWDFPPEATTPSFRKTVQDCINTFPSNK